MSLSTCRFCQRPWSPPEGVDGSRSYCRKCAPERREIARKHFAATREAFTSPDGRYLLSRARREALNDRDREMAALAGYDIADIGGGRYWFPRQQVRTEE